MSDAKAIDVAAETERIAALSFEAAQSELEQVVEKLDDPHTGLDEALTLWERGELLQRHCQRKLDYAAERLQQIEIDPRQVPAEQTPESDATPGEANQPDTVENSRPGGESGGLF